MSDFNIMNTGRKKRLFTPYNADEDAMDGSGDTYIMDQDVGTTPHAAYQFLNYDDENKALNDLSQQTAQMPKRDDYKPSIWKVIGQSLASGLLGASGHSGEGIAAGERLGDADYNDAMRDWQNKNKNLEDIANISARTMNARSHDAQVRNQHLARVDEIDLRRDQLNQTRENQERIRDAVDTRNADLRAAAEGKLNEQERHNRGMEAAAGARTAGYNARTQMLRDRPSGGKGNQNPYLVRSPQEAGIEAVKGVLAEEPGFKQYVDIDAKGGLTFKKDAKGMPAKEYNGKLIPLTPRDAQAIRDFSAKVNAKKAKFLSAKRSDAAELYGGIPGNVEYPGASMDEDLSDEEEYDR